MSDLIVKAYVAGANYAKQMGYKTIGMQDNPYNADDELALRKAWYRGYTDACRSAAEDMIE